MITKTSRKVPTNARPVYANQSITSNVQNRRIANPAAKPVNLTPGQRAFVRQIEANVRRVGNQPIMGATNTTNIMARPEFMELLPMFVQKLLILDVYGSVAMKSRQQLVPYFKFIAENNKGITKAGDVKSSPFVNRQGEDPDWTSRVVKRETLAVTATGAILAYTPVLPNSVSLVIGGDVFTDNGYGEFVNAKTGEATGNYIDYSTGEVTFSGIADGDTASYQYDNENVGPRALPADANGDYGYNYGAQMGKGYLQLDEFNLRAEAHQLASYWSIFSAFAAQQEYGSNIGDIAKEAAFSEITAEINARGFRKLEEAALYKPQFDWDASPVLSGAVVPHDYLNMFKLKLGQAAASIYQATRLARPNRLVVGTNVAEYISMIDGFKADNFNDSVGPYKLGTLDTFEIYVAPDQNPDKWVMSCKSNDIRRNSALFGEYMPLVATDPIGLANSSVQQGYATMYAMEVVNPATVVSGKILGTF